MKTGSGYKVVKAHTRKLKSGKVIAVKQYRAKCNSLRRERDGAGSELTSLKSGYEAPITSDLKYEKPELNPDRESEYEFIHKGVGYNVRRVEGFNSRSRIYNVEIQVQKPYSCYTYYREAAIEKTIRDINSLRKSGEL